LEAVSRTWPLALILGLSALTGCNDQTKASGGLPPPTVAAAPAAAAITDADRKQAEEIFSTRCMPCHGPQGMGNGPASAALTPPPRNFHDKQWQAAVTDQHIEQIIQYGGAAVGKSPAMPPNPDLVDKPVVKALREKLRAFGN
jgi:mono/diheme cytochrome c family protein